MLHSEEPCNKPIKIRLRLWLHVIVVLVLGIVFWVAQLEPLGGANSSCDDFEGASLQGAAGMVISFHMTACTTLGSDIATYVHIHRAGQPRTLSTLALRYSSAKEPEFVWIDSNTVRILVPQDVPITKQNNLVEGVRVEYVLGSASSPMSQTSGRI